MSNSSCCSCLSRRQCLGLLSAAAAGIGLAGTPFARTCLDGPDPGEFVDPLTLRPKPEVRVGVTILREPPPYWLGWPGTTYDLEKHQEEYLGKTRTSGKKLGITPEIAADPIQDEEGLTRWIAEVKETRPHGLLVILQHMSSWRWVDRLSREVELPLLVFAPIGTAFTGHVLHRSRREGVHVISSLEWSAVEAGLRMIRAKRMFEEARVLWIRSNQRNETVLDRLGTKVRAIPRDTFNELFDEMAVTEEVHEVAEALRRGASEIVEPTDQDFLNAARTYTTAKRLLATEKATSLSMDCLGMVGAKLVPTPPCAAWMMLQDQGITAGCEADLFGALSMMLSSFLLGRPGYMNDPVPETAKNLLIAAHCTSGSRIAGFDEEPAPYILRDHSESALGISPQILWPVGEKATLIRFQNTNELIVDVGEVVSNVDTPPAGGCRTSVEIAMDRVEDVRDVLGFHQVVVLGDHAREVEAFCQLYGIRTLRSPERSPREERKS